MPELTMLTMRCYLPKSMLLYETFACLLRWLVKSQKHKLPSQGMFLHSTSVNTIHLYYEIWSTSLSLRKRRSLGRIFFFFFKQLKYNLFLGAVYEALTKVKNIGDFFFLISKTFGGALHTSTTHRYCLNQWLVNSNDYGRPNETWELTRPDF